MNKKKNLILSLLAVLTVIIITGGVTYAFFSYTGTGTTDNVLTTDTITFLYTEVDGVGNGIKIENAFPISDEKGKALTKTNEYFDFKVTSKTASTLAIPYEITARKSSDSDDIDEYIRVYLTKGETNEEVLLDNYSELTQTQKVDASKYTEKTIYTGKVPSNTPDYEETFRLRMWLDEKTRFDTTDMNDKTFTLTVNVYANAKVVTEEEIAEENQAEIKTLTIEGTELTAVENEDYDYETTLPEDTTSTTINIETESPNATVKVEKIDSLAKSNSVKRLATTKTLELTNGENLFKVTVISENKKVENEFKIKIFVGNPIAVMDSSYSLSIGTPVTAVDGSKWHVLEASDETTETVVLLSDYNLNSDGSYNTKCGRDINSIYKCSTMAFDSDNTKTYNQSDNNNIGYFIKNTYAPLVTTSLPGTSNVTLPTAEQIATADEKKLNNYYEILALTNSWLITTNYWTRTSRSSTTYGVLIVDGSNFQLGNNSADSTVYCGARPVITTPKTNLLAE